MHYTYMISGIYYTFDETHIAFIRVKKYTAKNIKRVYIKNKVNSSPMLQS